MIHSAVYFLGGISNTDSLSQSEAPHVSSKTSSKSAQVSSNSSLQSEFTQHKKHLLCKVAYSLSSHCKSKVVVSTKRYVVGYIFMDDIHMSIT